MGSMVLGLFLLLLIGPAIWLPSLLRWGLSARTARARGPAVLLGDEGARVFYICLGTFVSLVGLWFVGSGVVGFLTRDKLRRSHIADRSRLPVSAPARIIPDMGLSGDALAFSADGASLLVVGDRTLRIVDVKSGTVRESFTVPRSGIRPPPSVQLMTSSGNLRFVAVGFDTGSTVAGAGKLARMDWERIKDFDLQTLPCRPKSVAISSNGRYALAAPIYRGDRSPVTDFCIIDFERDERFVLEEPSCVMQVAFRGDDDVAVLACRGSMVAIFDVAAQQVIAEIRPETGQPRGECWALSVSSDGRFAVTSHTNGDTSVRLWDLEKQVCVYRRELPWTASRVAFAPGRDWFATGGFMEQVIGLWDRETGKPFATLSTPTPVGNGIDALAISPTDDIVAARYDQDLFLWNVNASSALFSEDEDARKKQ